MKENKSRNTNPEDSFTRLDPDRLTGLQTPTEERESGGSRMLKWILFSVFGLMLLLGVFALYTTVSPRWNQVPNHVEQGLADDRLNILLLGVGGDAHPGGGKDLADTILVVSLKPSTSQVAMISVPRDLYVEVDRYGTHRINRAHQIGQQTGYPGGGPALAMGTVEEVIGVPMHAYARVDFAGFEDIINAVGGVEIDVKHAFYDYLFDDRFEAGVQRMDGDRALRYARYRYIKSEMGDNFSREARQRQVIEALRAEIRNEVSGDPIKAMKFARSLSAHTDTNLSLGQMVNLYQTFRSVDTQEIREVSLQSLTEIFEVRSIVDGGEALRPKTGDLDEIREAAREVFETPVEQLLTAR